MSIRRKLLLFIFIIGLVTILLVAIVSEIFIQVNVKNIEDIQVEESTNQIIYAFKDKIDRIDTFTVDYAGWDDTYNFIQDRNEEYITSNLINETLLTTQLNFMLYYNEKGEEVFSKAVDLNEGIGIFTPTKLTEKISQNFEKITQNNTNDYKKGFLVLDDGTIALFSSRPILTSTKQGPIRGSLIFGEFVDEELLKDIEEKTNKKIDLYIDDNVTDKERLNIERINNQYIKGNYTIPDQLGENTIVISVEQPRTYLGESRTHFIFLILIITLMGILSYIASAIYLDNIVIKPFAKIKYKLDEISAEKDLAARLEKNGILEINELIDTINNLLDKLSDYEVKLISLNEELKGEKQSVEDLVKKRTAELKKEHASLMATLNSIPEGLIITDNKLNIVSNNKQIYEILDLENTKQKLDMDNVREVLMQDNSFENVCTDTLEYGKPV
ncbi:MAG: hypothetical protein KC414_14165, partial [Romboutsia sp.]|nr:hypothetical protein [Romboutsia sp.]